LVIDHDSAVPVFRQVADLLAGRIARGEYAPGRPIPAEGRLEQELGVARGTIRKSIAQLRERGLVVTVPGKGTYVAGEPEPAPTA
jgi:GntR family transcriptional regulator